MSTKQLWVQFFDGIYLINLQQRTDRFLTSAGLLNAYDIPFERVYATSHIDPRLGLWMTMRNLFDDCLKNNKRNILVFEDDVDFLGRVPHAFNAQMDLVIRELDGKWWDMLSLGPNTHEPLERVSGRLLRMKGCRGLHATGYSTVAMIAATRRDISDNDLHIDEFFEKILQPVGHCYCTFPMLATQRNGYSDIEGKQVDQSYIVQRFERNTEHLHKK